MKLVLSAPNDTVLHLELEDAVKPQTSELSLTNQKIESLKQLSNNYQASIHQSDNTDMLYTLGNELFQLLNNHAHLVSQWLNNISRQLEIRTSLTTNSLELLLLDLPWEVMSFNKQFLAADTALYEVSRRLGEPNLSASQAKYKDLTLAFMAADPGLGSGLNYENEEQAILQATRNSNSLNLWVEESGNLDRLTQRVVESEHCDIVHISCHGGYDEKQDSFVLCLEDDYYHAQNVVASDFIGLSQQVQCIFLSACHSAETTKAPSFAMDLSKTGVANVIGWDGSVSDQDATKFASTVYQSLLKRLSVPSACAFARQKLVKEHLKNKKHAHWHLGRVYLTAEGGQPLVASGKPASPKRKGKAAHELFDNKKKVLPVASKETFVGRKRETKQALQAFDQNNTAGILLTGIGGTGKSSLAARIVHRMEPQYKAAIIYQKYSEVDVFGELKQFISGSQNQHFERYLVDIRKNPDLFVDNLVEMLEDHLSEEPVILVVDDLEQHVLEDLETTSESASTAGSRVGVKLEFQNVLCGLIGAFNRADTQSRLIFTSRYPFTVIDKSGNDLAVELLEIKVPDMNPTEQEKHWLALLQTGAVLGERNKEEDKRYLEQIRSICKGNPGLQDVLYKPLLAKKLTTLQLALDQLQAYHAGKDAVPTENNVGDVDKYLQRIALQSYHDALTTTERDCLRILSVFDFAVPQELIIIAGSKLGIDDARAAMQGLDNFGLLTYWQGQGLDGHISVYGLARKIAEPLSKQDRHHISTVCAPLLWQIWFKDFLQEYEVLETETLWQSIMLIMERHFPSKFNGELPLQGLQDQEYLALLHNFCISNSLTDWEELGFDSDELVDLLELSLSLQTFEKLNVSAASVDGFSAFQWSGFYKIFSEERKKFKELAVDHPQDIVTLLLRQFGGRPQLLSKGYQFYFGSISSDDKKILESIEIQNEEDRLLVATKLAKNPTQKASALVSYANFLADKRQNYAVAESMFLQALETDPNHSDTLERYANFLSEKKQDYPQAEVMFQRAIEANPSHVHALGNYAYYLHVQKQNYAEAEVMYQRAIEADPSHANALSNYAAFLADQKQNYAEAEVMYQRAIQTNPSYAHALGNYAIFLMNIQHDYSQAEEMYLRALEINPNDLNDIGNLTKTLFITEKADKARQYLEKAENQENIHPDLQLELAFYRYAHCSPFELTPIKQQLQSGSRSLGWHLIDNVSRAEKDGHPHPEMLSSIAKVINGDLEIEYLDQYPEWTNAL